MTGTPLENIAMQAEIAADGEPCSAEIDSTATLPAPGLFLLSRDFETSALKKGDRAVCGSGDGVQR